MLSKIKISATLQVVTGLHIGGSKEFSPIGAVDNPVVRDAFDNSPYIPGSSLKGKMRFLLAREYNARPSECDFDDIRIRRLFGVSDNSGVFMPARLIFSDIHMTNKEDLNKIGIKEYTEIKFENSISRLTAVAQPRQIERVIRGSEFGMEIIYNIDDEDEVIEDFETLLRGLKLMEYDYLGANGTRGYGRVAFKNLSIDLIIGQLPKEKLEVINAKIKDFN